VASTVIALVTTALAAVAIDARADIVSDFDDGSLQNWSKLEPFHGHLYNPGSGGAPGGYMRVEDTMAGGGGLYALAPPEFTGDLSAYTGIAWDESLATCSPPPLLPSYPILVGADGTQYRPRDLSATPTAVWRHRLVPFVETAWELVSGTGTASFAGVLVNVTQLLMNGDCNTQCTVEVGIDNVRLATAPIPSAAYSSVGCVTICPAGDATFDVQVIDTAGFPIPGAQVTVSFAACDSVVLCWPGPGDPYTFVQGRFTVARAADAAGRASFGIRGGGTSALPLAEVRADGVPLAQTTVASPDLDGDLTVGSADLALFMQRYQLGQWGPETDYNCDGFMDLADFALFSSHIQGHPGGYCTPAVHTLTVLVSGGGAVPRDPDRTSYDHGQSVRLTAVPDPGWRFDSWSGDVAGTVSPVDVVMDGDKTVTATFVPGAPSYTLTVNVVGQGTVVKDPDQPSYAAGTPVGLTAQPAVGWHFAGWSGDLAGTDNPATIVMDADRAVTATFEVNTYPLTVDVQGTGTVVRSPDLALYPHGTRVTLTPVPGSCWVFDRWEGDLTGAANPDSVLMDGAKSVTAVFSYPGNVPYSGWAPSCIRVVGTTEGVAHASAAFDVTVFNAAGCAVQGATVKLDFSGCPDIRPSATQAYPGVSVNCATHTVSAVTNASGVARFVVVGAVLNRGSSGAPGCVAIRADPGNVSLGTTTASAFDHDGRDGVDSRDLFLWLCDFYTGMQPPRADYNCASGVTGADLSLFLAHYFDELSMESGPRCDGVPNVSRVFVSPDSGLRLGWGDCDGGGGGRTLVLPCNTNSGSLPSIVGSVVMPAWSGYRGIVSFDAVVDIVTELGRPTPDWWRVDPNGCRSGALQVATSDLTHTCTDAGWSQLAGLKIKYPFGAPNVTRLTILGAVAATAAVPAAGDEVGLFELRFDWRKTTGAFACEGCRDSAMLIFRSIDFRQSTMCAMPANTDTTLRMLRGLSSRAYVCSQGPIGVDVPAVPFATRLAVRLLGGNPANGPLRLGLAAPGEGDVRLDVIDVSGRVVLRRTLESDAAERTVTLGGPGGLAPGVYFVRARQAGAEASLRAVVLQ
jgi:hypothetical protein